MEPLDYLFGLIVVLLGIVLAVIVYDGVKPCKHSHIETQWQQPASIVVGGSKYGGGIGLPMGNIRQVQVEVCDQR